MPVNERIKHVILVLRSFLFYWKHVSLKKYIRIQGNVYVSHISKSINHLNIWKIKV